MNLPFIASPKARAQHADKVAAEHLEAAHRSMDTQRLSAALERKRATTHALMALELREKREAAQ